jgi:hypothetical protein
MRIKHIAIMIVLFGASTIQSCTALKPKTELQQAQEAVTCGRPCYDSALKHFNAAESEDPKAATMGRCTLVVEYGMTSGNAADYCREAIEHGNKLPDSTYALFCKQAAVFDRHSGLTGTDSPQALSTSIFCQKTTPADRDSIATALRNDLELDMEGDIYLFHDFRSARKELASYKQTPGASQDLIKKYEQILAKPKGAPGTFTIMTPPTTGPNGLEVDANAPLSEWDSVPTGQKTVESCNALLNKIRTESVNAKATTLYGGPYPIKMVLDATMTLEVLKRAVCVAANDPRLE